MSAEYCQNEEFRAGCASSSVVVMRSARYGRMSVGRCVRRDYGFVGCGSDVLAITDQLCSGRRNCTVRVPNSWYDDAARRARCPEDFKNYLQVAFDCVDGQCLTDATYIIRVSVSDGSRRSCWGGRMGSGMPLIPVPI